VTPADKLAGREKIIFTERDRKLAEARTARQRRRHAGNPVAPQENLCTAMSPTG
jgi:hypothetical protein